jgi:tetratricopeptide (TPR) repeat protein
LENVALAAAVQEDQAARYPDNPDFPRQAAYNYRNAGNFKGYLKDFKGALEQYRKAEAIDRKLVARYPGRFELVEALRGDLDSIGETFVSLGDAPSALVACRDALSVATAAAQPNGQASGESLVSLALAHQGLSAALRAMSRWEDSITEQRAAVAIWERRVGGNPANQGLQRALSRSLEDLSRLYERRGDYRSALAESEKARRFLETDFAAHPDDESALTELRNALLCLRVQYAEVKDYDRALAAARQVVEMTKNTGVISRSSASRDLGDTLLRCGRRDEALTAFRRAALILDETGSSPGAGKSYPIEKEPSSFYRNALASSFLSLAAEFNTAHRDEESMAILKRLVPVLEAMVRDNPGNGLYRDTLLRTYRASSVSLLALGDLPGSRAFEQKAANLEHGYPLATTAAR